MHSEVVVDRNATMSLLITQDSRDDENMAKHIYNGKNDPREGQTEPVALEGLKEPSGAGICAGDSNSVRPGADQVNQKQPLAAMLGQLPGPEKRHITRSHRALSTDSPQVIKPVKANPTIKDLLEFVSSNHVQITKTLADITQRMTDYEHCLNFNYAKIADNEQAIDEIRKENGDLWDVIYGLIVELKQTRGNLEQVHKGQDDSERHYRESVMRVVHIEGAGVRTRAWSSWWRHQIEVFSALLALCAGNSPVLGEFPAQRPVTWSFDVLFDLRLNKWLSKQSWGWWFETLSCPLWGHSNGCRYDFLCCVVSVAFWWSWSLLSYQWLSNKPYISLTIVTDSFQIKCVLNH